MKHLSWNYKGYNDLGLNIVDSNDMQLDWNATILSAINEAFDGGDKPKNVFISRKYLPIFETIMFYNEDSKTIFNNKLIPIDIDTPKLYITESWLDVFVGLEHNNYGSVVIKNYTE